MNETIRIDDMRLFAAIATARSFTAAARTTGIPKQTLSRRITELERALGVRLMHRTTRRLELTDTGATYADRCVEIVRLAGDANRSARDAQDVPQGLLRITADPVFGEAFLDTLVVDYARAWPEVRLAVELTRRRVDLVAERYDIAFRVGRVDDLELAGIELGPARVRYCASPAYLARRGMPKRARDLRHHDCLTTTSDGEPTRWPIAGKLVAVSGRIACSSFAIVRAAALAGLGIAIFPEFACAEDVRRKRLVPVLGDTIVDVGGVWLLHARRQFLPASVRAFADLAKQRFMRDAPWTPRR